jgi:hypothetical protein
MKIVKDLITLTFIEKEEGIPLGSFNIDTVEKT